MLRMQKYLGKYIKSLFKNLNILKLLFFLILTILVLNNTIYQYKNKNIVIEKNKIGINISQNIFDRIFEMILINKKDIDNLKEKNNYKPNKELEANVIVSSTKGVGSGSIIKISKDETYILTAAHVILEEKIIKEENGNMILKIIPMDYITIKHKNYERIEAKIIKFDTNIDLAILKIDKKFSVTPIKIAKAEPKLGETVWAISNPVSIYGVINKGIYSHKYKKMGIVSLGAFYGSSGGMCLNNKGEQIGIISSVILSNNSPYANLTILNEITRTKDLNLFLEGIL